VANILCPLLQLYLVALFGRIILSWFPISAGSALASIYGFLYTITEPVLGPVRRVIPPLGGGGMAFDLSPC
jgi:YggT family protein